MRTAANARRASRAAISLALAAALWTAGIGAAIWFTSPFRTMSHYGALPLLVFAGLAALAMVTAWRGRLLPYTIATLAFGVLGFVSGFSIGGYYIPALALLLFGVLAMMDRQPSGSDDIR